MAKKPQPPKPIIWSIYKVAAKAVRLGEVGAPDTAAAIEKIQGPAQHADGRTAMTRRRRSHPQ